MKRINVKLDVEMIQKCSICGRRVSLEQEDPEDEEWTPRFVRSECCETQFVITPDQGVFATKETVDLFKVNYADLTIQKSPLPIRMFQRWYQIDHMNSVRTRTGQNIENKEDYKYFQKNYPFDFHCTNSDLYHVFLATIDTGIGRDNTFIVTHRRDHSGDRFGPQGCRDLDCILGISSENDLPAFIFQGRQYLSIFSRQISKWQDGITLYEARIIRRSRTILDLSHQDVYVTKAKFPGDRKETYLMGTNRDELLKLTRKKIQPPKKKKVKKPPHVFLSSTKKLSSSTISEKEHCKMIVVDSIVGHHHTDAKFTVKVKDATHFKELYGEPNGKKKTGWLKRLIGR